MSDKLLFATAGGILIGSLLTTFIITTRQVDVEPDELLLAEAVGHLCAAHEYANENVPDGTCYEFCDIVFLNEPQTSRCEVGYTDRTLRIITVESAMADSS
ncbi:MAG: hypothetical protein NXH70_02285 [Hyphomonas sp.]|nr:hypothetical protein [Hyphomonas sp.]